MMLIKNLVYLGGVLLSPFIIGVEFTTDPDNRPLEWHVNDYFRKLKERVFNA